MTYFFRNKDQKGVPNIPVLGDQRSIELGSSVNDHENSPTQKEVDVSSVIQERPGTFAYPYRVQPGDAAVI